MSTAHWHAIRSPAALLQPGTHAGRKCRAFAIHPARKLLPVPTPPQRSSPRFFERMVCHCSTLRCAWCICGLRPLSFSNVQSSIAGSENPSAFSRRTRSLCFCWLIRNSCFFLSVCWQLHSMGCLFLPIRVMPFVKNASFGV